MDVFIPALKDTNPFFDEIMRYSRYNFIFDDFKAFKNSYKTVLIHWPEQIFKLEEPTKKELQELAACIDLWKQHAKIVYVVHNLERHLGMTRLFSKLYQLIETNCDEMIHFGAYSKNLMQQKYPLKQHTVIFHPLYKNSFKIYEKETARKALGIKKNGLVIFVPGNMRNNLEKKLILKSFHSISEQNKVLLVSRMFIDKFSIIFRDRYFFKRRFKINFKSLYGKSLDLLYTKPTYFFNYTFLEAKEFSLMVSAADIVFVPRIKILNSGNVFLAMTYQKIMIGPDKGNVSETLKKLKMPLFNPKDSNSVKKALEDAIYLHKSAENHYDANILSEYAPKVIAQQWDAVLSS